MLLAVGCSTTQGHGSLDPITAYFGSGGSPIPALDQPAGKAVTTAAQAAQAHMGEGGRIGTGKFQRIALRPEDHRGGVPADDPADRPRQRPAAPDR